MPVASRRSHSYSPNRHVSKSAAGKISCARRQTCNRWHRLMETKILSRKYAVSTNIRLCMFELARRSLLKGGLLAALLLPLAANGGVLSDSDLQKVETLKPLFAGLMNDLSQ